MELRPVQAHHRLRLVRHPPVLCCCRRTYVLVPVTTGDVVLAKLWVNTSPDCLLLLLLICTSTGEGKEIWKDSWRSPLYRSDTKLKKALVLPVSYFLLQQWCSSSGAEVYDSLTNPSLYNDSWPVMGMSRVSHDVTVSWGERSLPAEQSARTALKLAR